MCEGVGEISADAIDSIATAIAHCKTDNSEVHTQASKHLSKKRMHRNSGFVDVAGTSHRAIVSDKSLRDNANQCRRLRVVSKTKMCVTPEPGHSLASLQNTLLSGPYNYYNLGMKYITLFFLNPF